jgi:hypothetical protein
MSMLKFLKRAAPDEAEEDSSAKAAKPARPEPSNDANELLETLTDESWRSALQAEASKSYFATLASEVARQRRSKTVYPPRDQVFAAFNLTPLPDVRVVVIGQDPYHGPGQAHGLSFSVGRGVAVPPSLKNIYQELETDLAGAFKRPSHGNLEAWAKRGVLLLNATRARRAAHGRGLLAAAPPARACTGHESAVLRADLRARLTPRRQ